MYTVLHSNFVNIVLQEISQLFVRKPPAMCDKIRAEIGIWQLMALIEIFVSSDVHSIHIK